MDSLPLVSVICLCYNQKQFVTEAINSVLTQTYQNIELIVVDDASSDGSQSVIKSITDQIPAQFISLTTNVGNCRAFNLGLKKCKGTFIIDLAADDVLLPHRVEIGINDFVNAPPGAGVHFSDAFLVNAKGEILRTHYHRNTEGQITEEVPSGDVFSELISRYFICPPTMMIKRKVLDELQGYDENLTYEDFDFWIRSARNWHYLFNRAPLVKRRLHQQSLGHAQNRWWNKHQKSTLEVCKKIYALSKQPDELSRLKKRCLYEIRQCIKTGNLGLIPDYIHLYSLARSGYLRLSSASSIDR